MKQVLVILTCLGVLVWTVFGVPHAIRKSCCLKYTVKLPRLNKITKYEIQNNNGRCRINAVLFFVHGKAICTDPADGKVQRFLEILYERERRC